MPGLFDSIEIGGSSLRNRLVLPPMQTGLATDDGGVTEEMLDYYEERSKENGLVIVEHSYVSDLGRFASNQLGIHKDDLIGGLEDLADVIKGEGAKAAVQVNHAGGRVSDTASDREAVGPSDREGVRKLGRDDIDRIVKEFSQAARRAAKAGFDAVEVHGAHGFLLGEFYSPLSNRRTDEFGGSFENRIKVPIRVVEEVREEMGDGLLLYRLGSVDLDDAGIQIEDSVNFAKKLVDAGVDIVDVSGGLCGSRPSDLSGEQGYFVPQASRIREAVEVPVIGVGGITDPGYADRIVREGMVDMVAVGRAQKADSGWGLKARRKLKR